MSPEICNKEKYDGAATDMWASGIILYSMLFGQQPFRAAHEADLYRKIQKGIFKIPAIDHHKDVFEAYPEIQNASTVKNMLEDILRADEKKRITASELLEKYTNWLK